MRLEKSVESETRETDTLLTDAPGLSEIAQRRIDNKVLNVASPSILQGGRGVLDEANAATVASGIAHGFVAAASLATGETRQAVALFKYFFRRAYATRLTQFLRAVWVGAGGDSDDFPEGGGNDRELSSEALTFLLQIQARSELSFWRRVGHGLTIEKLTSLNAAPSRNLDDLIAANLDRLRARAIRAEPVEAPSTAQSTAAWRTSRDCITWQGGSYSFLFVESKVSLRHRETDLPGIDLRGLLERAWRNRVAIESLEIASGGRIVSYGVSAGSRSRDVTLDEELARLIESLGHSAVAKKATISVAARRNLVCDFEDLVASGRSGAKFSVFELLRIASPLLADLSTADMRLLANLLVDAESAVEQQSLF